MNQAADSIDSNIYANCKVPSPNPSNYNLKVCPIDCYHTIPIANKTLYQRDICLHSLLLQKSS